MWGLSVSVVLISVVHCLDGPFRRSQIRTYLIFLMVQNSQAFLSLGPDPPLRRRTRGFLGAAFACPCPCPCAPALSSPLLVALDARCCSHPAPCWYWCCCWCCCPCPCPYAPPGNAGGNPAKSPSSPLPRPPSIQLNTSAS